MTAAAKARAFRDRLRGVIVAREPAKTFGYALSSFSTALDIPEDTAKSWLSDSKGRLPSFENLRRIAEVTHLSLDWLVMGVGPQSSVSREAPEKVAVAAFRQWLVGDLVARGIGSPEEVEAAVKRPRRYQKDLVALAEKDVADVKGFRRLNASIEEASKRVQEGHTFSAAILGRLSEPSA